MATIDQLNFEVILDDANFNQKVQADLQLARDLNVNLTQALNVAATSTAVNIDGSQAMGSIQQIQTALQAMMTSLQQQANLNVNTAQSRQELDQMKQILDQILQNINNINGKKVGPNTNLGGLRQYNSALREQGVMLRQLSTLAMRYFSVYGLTRFMGQLVDITGEFEVQQMALRTILNDAEKADEIFGKLRQFAVESPFTFQELAKYTKQLAAFDIPTDQLLETNKMLADVSAGLGVSMDRLILAYGHVKSSGFLRGMQLRQFTQNGVPILEQLSDILTEIEGKTVSVGQVFDRMTKRQIDFSMVEEAFRRMTSEGGKFYKMQEVLVETLKGRMGKLRDVWQQAMYDLGESQSATLKGVVDFAIKFVSHLQTIAKVIAPVIAGLGAYTTSLLVAFAAEKAMVALNYAKHLLVLVTNLNRAAAVMRLYHMSLSGVIGVVTALVTATAILVKHLHDSNSAMGIAAKHARDFASETAKDERELKSLCQQLNDAAVGTDRYNQAKDRILSKYGDYLSAVDKENLKLGRTAGLYESIAAAAKEAAKEKFISSGMDELGEQYSNKIKKASKNFDSYMELLADEEEEIRKQVSDYIRGLAENDTLTEGAQAALNKANRKTWGASADAIRNMFTSAAEQYQQGVENLNKLFQKSSSLGDDLIGPPKVDLAPWQRKVREALLKISPEIRKAAEIELGKDDNDYYAYLERVGKAWKTIREQRDKALGADKATYDSWLKAIQAVDRALEGNILSDARYNKSPWEAKDNKTQEEIRELTAKINTLNKLRESYEKLTEYVSEARAKEILSAGAGGDESILGFISTDAFKVANVLREIDKLKALDPDKAASFAAALGKDQAADAVEEWKKLQATTKQYFESIRSWVTEDTDIEGKGFFYDLSKAGSELETKLNKVNLQATKAKETLNKFANIGTESMEIAIKGLVENGVDEATAREFWNTWITGGSAAIDDFVKEYSEKATAASRERVTGLAKSYLEEQYFLDGIDLSHISDKTMRQLRTLKEKLMDILTNMKISEADSVNLEVLDIDPKKINPADLESDAVKQMLDETTISTLRLMSAVQKAGGSWDDFTEAVQNAVDKGLKNITEEEKKSLYDFAKKFVSNVTSMATAYKEFAEVTGNDNLSSAIEGFEALGNIVGNVLERLAAGDVPGAVVAAIAGIWNEIAKAVTASARLKAAIASVAEEADRLSFSDKLKKGVDSLFGTDTYRNVRNAAEEIRKFDEALGSLEGIKITKPVMIEWKTGLFNWGRKSANLSEMVTELGLNYFDEFGNINAKALDKILEVYPELTDESKAWIEKAKKYAEEYAEAMKVIEDATKSIFGNIADSAADTIIDSWIEAGHAALDYADILDDVAKSYAKMVLKSVIMENFFDEKTAKNVAKLFSTGKEEEAMATVAEAFDRLSGAAPLMEQILQAFDPYFKRTATGANQLGESIRNSINEEQANLIASYVNAIRADLSYMRGRQTQYFDFMLGAMPTLAEHVAAIDAHTFDIMMSNAEIANNTASALAELRSVITTTTGETAVRIATT